MTTEKFNLTYNKEKWIEETIRPVNTLQLFITNKCNLRCKGCFYQYGLGFGEMSIEGYQQHVLGRLKLGNGIKKVILLGGEPTLHKDLGKMVAFNNLLGLQTTIYSNGYDINKLAGWDLEYTDVRVSVYGFNGSEKPITKIVKTDIPTTIVLMLRKDNVAEINEIAQYSEEQLGCKKFYISSIRDIATSGSYWKDTPETLPMKDYYNVVQNFVSHYNGNMQIHISRRGVIDTENNSPQVNHCRFLNIFPNGTKILCPFDICKNITTTGAVRVRKCNKNNECLLRKIVLTRAYREVNNEYNE